MTSHHIKVLSKNDRVKTELTQPEASDEDSEAIQIDPNPVSSLDLGGLKHASEANTFKLIDDREWNIATSEPNSETTFFADGHSAMSLISVIGSKGVGKSSLLNKIARKEIFKTYKTSPRSSHIESSKVNVKHITKGIDIHSTHHRILLDCQPLLATSVLEDFLSGHSSSQFPKNTLISDPLTSCHMISLQMATFLIATSDYVIIMAKWLIDVHLLKLISSAIMMIGKDNLRAKFIIYSEDEKVHDKRFKLMVDSSLGTNRVEKYFSNENELLNYVGPYSSEKCELYQKDPSTFTGKNWLASCQRLWNTTIRNSSMFSDYALQIYNSNAMMI